MEINAISKTSDCFIEGTSIMDDKLQELLDWMFFRTLRSEAIEILTNQLAPVQRDAIIERLEELKKKKEAEDENEQIR